jgi:hypothetical protein
MLQITDEALRDGCERVHDLFQLNQARDYDDAAKSFDAVFDALGVDAGKRARLHDALLELVPVKGDALLEANTVVSMLAGVLAGLLIADSALPADEFDLPLAPA